MPTLEQITETGIFSLGTSGFHREFVPFDEELTAESFAEEINSGRLSVRDAYVNFWSYEEDAELWDLPKDGEWRALLPDWKPVLLHMASILDDDKAQELVDIVCEGYFDYIKIHPERYNPFFDDLSLIPPIIHASGKVIHGTERIVKLFSDKLKYKRDPEIDNMIDKIFRSQDYKQLKFLGHHLYGEDAENYVTCLYQIGSNEALQVLGKHLLDPRKKVSERAAEYLGLIGGERAERILFDALVVTNRRVDEIFNALGRIGSQKAIEFLIGHLYDPRVYSPSAALALGETRSGQATEPLIKYLHEAKGCSLGTEYATQALLKIGTEKAIGALIEYLSNPESKGRCAVAEELSKAKVAEAEDASINFLNEAEGYIITIGAEALIRMGSEKSITALNDYLSNTRNWDKEKFEDALFKTASKETEESLIKYMSSGRAKGKSFLAQALGKIRSKRATEWLVDYIFDPEDNYRYYGVETLFLIEGERATEVLIKYLFDPKSVGRGWAAKALASIGTKMAIDAIIEYISTSGDPERCHLMGALTKTESEKAVDVLIDYISNPKNPWRFYAIEAIGEIGSERAAQALIEYINTTDDESKPYAIRALGKIGHYDALLSELLSSENIELRASAAEALIELRHYDTRLLDFINEDAHFSVSRIIDGLAKMTQYQILKDIKRRYGLNIAGMIAETTRLVQHSLKPQGYNPPVKRLAA